VKTATSAQASWKTTATKVLGELGLLLSGAFLFALAFPSFLSKYGFAPLAFAALLPVFVLVHRCSWKLIAVYGLLYGFVSYALFNFWLSTFHPLAILIVPTIYAVYFLIVFPLLKAADSLFPRYGYLIQILIWIGYEYLRTKGYLGYPYGNIGYSQYQFIPFIQISALTGFWGVSALVVFPSAFIGNAVKDGLSGFWQFIRAHKPEIGAYAGLIVLTLVYGIAVQQDYSDERQWRVALVQHNADSWEGGIRTYRRNLEILTQLSERALEHDPEIVIWSETAFIPGVDWHTKYRTDPDRYALVEDFREFMRDQPVPFITGNDDGQLANPNLPPVLPNGSYNRVDYNAVLLYQDNELKKIYRKTHLVPFTEHFPYEDTMPRFHQLLVKHDYHFWEKGLEYTVFEAAGVKFSTPICFEDVFGYISRRFINEGAEIIVNMTNDSWSGSVAAQMQHMAMAVFRAIENRRSFIRGTNSGMTCTIDPDGRIIDMMEPFVRDYMISEVPVYTGRTTPYTRWGNYFPIVSIALAVLLLGAGLIARIVRPPDSRSGK
jgi:apolipoprotein N-acyltransferase